MAGTTFKYVIIGGGLAGYSAARALMEADSAADILILCREAYPPYDRPPLSKKLWTGKKRLEEVFLGGPDFYKDDRIELKKGIEAFSVDTVQKTVAASDGLTYKFGKLLIATGGSPRRLNIPGGGDICYYRTLDDYKLIRAKAREGASAVIIGAGFIGSEMAAALSSVGVNVTMVYPSPYIASKVLPEGPGRAVEAAYVRKGVRLLGGRTPVSVERRGEGFLTRVSDNSEIPSDIVLAGVGIAPDVSIAANAGISTGDGIIVDECLETGVSGIYAAGDNAFFPYGAIGRQARVEHWDNAIEQGATAGRNMAGGREKYTHMPYFFSDLFDFGYEAVGEVDSALPVYMDWQEEYKKGVIYYLKDGMVAGVMLCNVWDRVEAARDLIRKRVEGTEEALAGALT